MNGTGESSQEIADAGLVGGGSLRGARWLDTRLSSWACNVRMVVGQGLHPGASCEAVDVMLRNGGVAGWGWGEAGKAGAAALATSNAGNITASIGAAT